MDRREFIKRSAATSLIGAYPSVVFSSTELVIEPSGGNDTNAINAALKASARTGNPAVLSEGAFTITDSIVVPVGACLIGKGKSSTIAFEGGNVGVVVRVEQPSSKPAVTNLYVEDKRSSVPFVALIG